MSEPAEPEVQVWDSLQDLVALIGSYRAGDVEAQRVLMANCDQPMVLSVAVHLLAQMAREHNAGYPELMTWGIIAMGKAG